MMSEKDTGGQAFPVGDLHWEDGGMTLRDYFAAQALIGMGTWAPYRERDFAAPSLDLSSPAVLADRAAWAYAQADAMLAHRDPERTEERSK